MRMVVLSVAHSWSSYGAINRRVWLKEYDVSQRATEAAAAVLKQHSCPVCVIDVGDNPPSAYARIKTEVINAINPSIAVEIHCNASDDQRANYGEVIHHPSSPIGLRAAVTVADHLRDTLGSTKHHPWPMRGAREWSLEHDKHQFFFLKDTNCPAIIVEGVFISNDEQAEWLASAGGAEAYGAMVGEGISLFIEREKL